MQMSTLGRPLLFCYNPVPRYAARSGQCPAGRPLRTDVSKTGFEEPLPQNVVQAWFLRSLFLCTDHFVHVVGRGGSQRLLRPSLSDILLVASKVLGSTPASSWCVETRTAIMLQTGHTSDPERESGQGRPRKQRPRHALAPALSSLRGGAVAALRLSAFSRPVQGAGQGTLLRSDSSIGFACVLAEVKVVRWYL